MCTSYFITFVNPTLNYMSYCDLFQCQNVMIDYSNLYGHSHKKKIMILTNNLILKTQSII